MPSEIASRPHRIGIGKNSLVKKVTKDYKYVGHYLNGLRDGDGLLINFKQDYIYDGRWKNDQMDGFGKFTMGIKKDGRHYEGYFKNNNYDGLVSSKYHIPYAHHYNPLLIRKRSQL